MGPNPSRRGLSPVGLDSISNAAFQFQDREPYNVTPVNKLALLNMPSNVDRNAIAMVLAASGYLPQDIRVINRRGEPCLYSDDNNRLHS
ncbi:unnamed protein product [Nippostrongylus brasiliensis]|uniref:Cellulose synthase regulatory subunit n=1 Tax=Nippostrongylus brasiliensis TaxID=27835 RepID=A0A0N4XRQ6_NIPBR|nr:unnamed protein product [Nippostrongylus brasiliensis]